MVPAGWVGLLISDQSTWCLMCVTQPVLPGLRYQFITDRLLRYKSRTLVDLGCGEGRLVEHVLKSCAFSGIESVAGIDRTASALRQAGKRVASFVEHSAEGHVSLQPPSAGQADAAVAQPPAVPSNVSAPSPSSAAAAPPSSDEPAAAASATNRWSTSVTFLHGSFAQPALTTPSAWGALHRPDLATLVEVVEHLDPEPLALLGPVLLDGLQPKVAIITTPNIEYNQVLRKVRAAAPAEGAARRGPCQAHLGAGCFALVALVSKWHRKSSVHVSALSAGPPPHPSAETTCTVHRGDIHHALLHQVHDPSTSAVDLVLW